MRSFRILVVDDHEVVRLGIRAMLEGHEGWEVCGEAADGREGVDKAAQIRPDLVILDLNMPRLNGLGAAHQMLRNESRPQILILADSYSEGAMREALEIGVRGVLLKSDPGSDLLAAIDALQTGRTFFTSGLVDLLLDGYLNSGCERSDEDPCAPRLTVREREVVQLLAEGSSTKQVAKVLGLSVKTAETHRSNVMRKLRLHSLSELVLYAVRNGIVSVPNSQECGLTPAPMSRGCRAALGTSAVQGGVTAGSLSATLM
ncbi:MAG TPA: response regulator transcription factor [Candidatus Sulfotelmatobacter sp.]|nr:response regulator transcription factor [Candidatus Sulfotelmatobacter sp.]